MPKYNNKIHAWLKSKTGEKLIFKAFLKEKDPINGLLKRIILPRRFDYPEAIIYEKGKPIKRFCQGIETSISNYQRWYGPNISLYKLKLILKDDNSYIGPFYSNSFASVDNQLQLLIDEYINGVYKDKFSSAIIIDLKQDKIIRKF